MKFTPIRKGERIEMEIEDINLPRGKENKGKIYTVTEKETGKQYRAKVISCSLPKCYCDAEIVED